MPDATGMETPFERQCRPMFIAMDSKGAAAVPMFTPAQWAGLGMLLMYDLAGPTQMPPTRQMALWARIVPQAVKDAAQKAYAAGKPYPTSKCGLTGVGLD